MDALLNNNDDEFKQTKNLVGSWRKNATNR